MRENERDSLHFLRYDICERLERYPGVLASELTDCRIAAILQPAQSGSAEEIALALIGDVYDSYGIRPAICVTGAQDSPFALAEAYEQARCVLALRYYLPDQSLLRVWEHLPAVAPDEALWSGLLSSFESALNSREIAPALHALEQAVDALAEQRLSAEERQRRHEGFIDALRAAFRQQRRPFNLHELVRAPNLGACHQIMARLCTELCECGKTSGEEKAEAVILYINAHLGDDLTLDHLADRFGLSRSYLSRMFSVCRRANDRYSPPARYPLCGLLNLLYQGKHRAQPYQLRQPRAVIVCT
ncbi:MAG: hypothetical protein ACOX8S_08600 [Christensenellales bacterium]